jgi:hypothetical protein
LFEIPYFPYIILKSFYSGLIKHPLHIPQHRALMNNPIPTFDQFDFAALEHSEPVPHPNAEINLKIDIIPTKLNQRVAVGIVDESGSKGIAVAIYPATGEVCDISHGGEVMGYLSKAPLTPNDLISCELSIFRFGRNYVCSVTIQGETFLYPAYLSDESSSLRAVIGKEKGPDTQGTPAWKRLHFDVQPLPIAA